MSPPLMRGTLCKVVEGKREGSNIMEDSEVLKLGAVLQGGEEEVSDEATETVDHAFEKCVCKDQKKKKKLGS